MVFGDALATDQSTKNTETSTTDHVVASDLRLLTFQWQAVSSLTMSRDFLREADARLESIPNHTQRLSLTVRLSTNDDIQFSLLKHESKTNNRCSS